MIEDFADERVEQVAVSLQRRELDYISISALTRESLAR